jgi:hypothetical protein
MRKLLLALILVLATVLVNAQNIYHSTSIQTGQYSKKLKKWKFSDPVVNEVSIIFNEGAVYVSDVNNSRYIISDQVDDISDDKNVIYAVKGLDKDKKDVIVFLIKDKISEGKLIMIYWNSSARAIKYQIKNDEALGN